VLAAALELAAMEGRGPCHTDVFICSLEIKCFFSALTEWTTAEMMGVSSEGGISPPRLRQDLHADIFLISIEFICSLVLDGELWNIDGHQHLTVSANELDLLNFGSASLQSMSSPLESPVSLTNQMRASSETSRCWRHEPPPCVAPAGLERAGTASSAPTMASGGRDEFGSAKKEEPGRQTWRRGWCSRGFGRRPTDFSIADGHKGFHTASKGFGFGSDTGERWRSNWGRWEMCMVEGRRAVRGGSISGVR
jgi:hypothetical protein